MTLTASDVASLTATMGYWEDAGYLFAFLVAVACFGEYVADFTKWWEREEIWSRLGPVDERKDNLAKLSTLVLIVALVMETVCLFRTNQISGEVLGSLTGLSDEAFKKATKAKEDAGTAIARSELAEDASGGAVDKSGKAETVASAAMTLARGARIEADTFKHEIELAKEQATAAEAAAEHERIARADRELSEAEKAKLFSEIRSFDKTITYWFNSRIGDSDAKRYADKISAVLSSAGLRVVPSDGLMGNSELVGTWVAVSSKAPTSVKAAAGQMLSALRASGLPHVNRTSNDDKLLNTDIGIIDLVEYRNSFGVEILIGRKPREGE